MLWFLRLWLTIFFDIFFSFFLPNFADLKQEYPKKEYEVPSIKINIRRLVIIHLDLLKEKTRNNHRSEHWKIAFIPEIPFFECQNKENSFQTSFYRAELWLTVLWIFPLCGSEKSISHIKTFQLELFNNLHLAIKSVFFFVQDLKYSDNFYVTSWLLTLNFCFLSRLWFFSSAIASLSY